MITNEIVAKRKRFEAVYKSHADNLYKICLYYSKDEETAKCVAQQAFFNFYKYFDEVEPEYILGYLVREAKELLFHSQHHELVGEEAEE